MKVAIYCRVSRKEEDMNNQLLQLRNYCNKSGWKVYDEYCDIASYKDKRPAYDRMFVDAHKKLFDLVLFWAFDRFSRAGATYTLQKIKELENLGIDFHSYSEPYVNSDDLMYRDVTISIMGAFAKLEREKISDRTKAGLQRIKSEGKILGRKQIPKKVINQVVGLLSKPNPPSYKKISEQVIYKTKYGKQHHISTAMVCHIKKQCITKESLK